MGMYEDDIVMSEAEMVKVSRNFLESVKKYVELTQVNEFGIWADAEEVKAFIKNGEMPELYSTVVELLEVKPKQEQ